MAKIAPFLFLNTKKSLNLDLTSCERTENRKNEAIDRNEDSVSCALLATFFASE